MRLIYLDLETTGLDPVKGKILEVAAAVADLSAPFDLGAFLTRVLPLAESEYGLMDDYVRNMHTKNGLLVECVQSTAKLADVEQELLDLLPTPGTYEREDTPTLAGSSIHFDHAWLKVHMPTFAKRVSHRHYDVSAVKLFCRSLGMTKPPVAEAHRAEPDVRESVAHAKLCAQWLRVERIGPEW
jgi:oligoribonuclease